MHSIGGWRGEASLQWEQRQLVAQPVGKENATLFELLCEERNYRRALRFLALALTSDEGESARLRQ